MTGTSIDGIDAALVRLEGHGLELRPLLLRLISRSLGPLADPLRAASSQQPMTAGEFSRLAYDFGRLHAEVIDELVGSSSQPDLIVVHGQTVFHDPPCSWQLINPAPIEHRFACPVISDLRQADLAAGGQGAPITPLADWIMFRDEERARAIVNLGGFLNVTMLSSLKSSHEACAMSHEGEREQEKNPDLRPGRLRSGVGRDPILDTRHLTPATHNILNSIRGFDLCSCNQLLDAISRKGFGDAYDEGGTKAGAGVVRDELVNDLLMRFGDLVSKGSRSLGTGDEATQWVHDHLGDCPAADLAASAIEAIARFLAGSIDEFALREYPIDEIILAGGGTRNHTLFKAIEKQTQRRVLLSDDCGVPSAAREAMAMAILGALRSDGVPITLEQVTGRETRTSTREKTSLAPKLADQVIP